MISSTLRRGRALASLAVGALIAGLAVTGIALPATAAEGGPQPSITVSPSTDVDPSIDNEFTVNGEGFTGPGAASGVYVLLGDAAIWAGDGPLRAEGWLEQDWVQARNVVDGEFSLKITVPANAVQDGTDYTVATSAAHGLSATDRSLDAFAPITLREVVVPDPEPTEEPSPEPTTDPEPEPTTDPEPEPTTEPQPDLEPAPVPSVTVSKTTGLDADGETVTVTGSGFLPTAETTGKRPPLAGKFTGAYVGFGRFPDVWEPSKGAPSTDRKMDDHKWAVHAENMATIGGPQAGAGEIKADGTFEFDLNVSKSDDLEALKSGNYGIYTYPGGGATYAPFETFTPLEFTPASTGPGAGGDETPVKPTKPKPTPDKPKPAKPAPSCKSDVIADSSLVWGVKESFTSYIGGKIAKGTTSVSGKTVKTSAGNTFTWTGGKGTYSAKTGKGEIKYRGSVNFKGHGDILDVTFSNPKIVLKDKKNADLIVSGRATNMENDKVWQKTVTIGKVDLSRASVTTENGVTTFRNAPATLTAAGENAFSGFYDAGVPLDALSFVLPSDCATGPIPSLGHPKPQANAGVNPGGGQQPGKSPSGGNFPVVKAPTAAQTPAETCSANSVAGATMSWGIKQAFVSYIQGGIANGSFSTSGASQSGGKFAWANGSGAVNVDKMMGTARFGGSVNFKGHGGILDLTISSPRIILNGPSSATLVVDVVGSNMEGDKLSYPGVAFGSLNLAAGSVNKTGSSIDYSGVPVTLTSAGSKAFIDFYDAGSALDPISFSLPLGGVVPCDVSTGSSSGGKLAATGAEGLEALGLSAAALLLVGFGGVIAARRRSRSGHTV